MTPLDAMKQALEALYASIDVPCYEGHPKQEAAYEALRTAIEQMEKAEPVAWLPSTEWTSCIKLPVTVHVRKQREGEQHISTREGLTPLLPDDLIMRGVQGEEYPIGREIFARTYQMGSVTHPAQSRDSIIEECAEAALNAPIKTARQEQREACAAAIRALKGK